MKNTPFTHKHIESGAKMAEFAAYNMPIRYTGKLYPAKIAEFAGYTMPV